MKASFAVPCAAAVGGAGAFALRLWQNQTCFEPDTGLPIPGAPAGMVLLGFFAVMAALFSLLAWRLPKDAARFPAAFRANASTALTLPVMGIFLIGISGAMDIAGGLGLLQPLLEGGGMASVSPFPPQVSIILGGLSLISAVGLFSCALDCRPTRSSRSSGSSGRWLLPPVVMLVVHLVLSYRVYSIDPALSAYYVRILAQVFLTLGFYRLSSFAFQSGSSRRLCLYACGGVMFALSAFADSLTNLSAAALYLGGALTLLGFLYLRLAAGERGSAAQPADGETPLEEDLLEDAALREDEPPADEA